MQGGSGYAATVRLRYLDSELGGCDENNLALWRNNGSGWVRQSSPTRNLIANWVEQGGVTVFSDWAISDLNVLYLPLISR